MIFTLKAEDRNTVKKSELTALRASGMIPAIVYGSGVETTKLSINSAEFYKCYKKSFTELAFYELNHGDKKFHTILKAKQMHPVTRLFLHLDFMVLDAESTMELDIPLNIVGEPIGLKEGGFMDVIQRTIKVVCKVSDIPDELELDVSSMKVGDTKHIGDLRKGAWTYKDQDDATLVVIHARTTAAEPTEEEPAAEEEPEA